MISKILAAAVMTAVLTIIPATIPSLDFAPGAYAGNCDVPSDRAADGSRCGGRAASERDGGK
jgi:hypothetical protein